MIEETLDERDGRVERFLAGLTKLTKETGLQLGHGAPAYCYLPGINTETQFNVACGGVKWDDEKDCYVIADC